MRLYEMLASAPYDTRVEWTRVSFFFGDERYVPPDHPDSNFRMASMSLLRPLGIAEEHIFAIDTSLPPGEAADDYEMRIRRHFGEKDPHFDIILLGIGDNAHTASLFPDTEVLEERSALVKAVFVEEVNAYRITFTAPLINMAHAVVFLVYGASKAEAVHHILGDVRDYRKYPGQLVGPKEEEVHWFLDEAAAGSLKASLRGG